DKDNHKPNLNTLKEGDKVISGTGKPGDQVVVRDNNGNDLGIGLVDSKGNFNVKLNRDLRIGEKLTVLPFTGKTEGSKTTVQVSSDLSKHIPVSDEIKSGDKHLTGKGIAGDKIIVTDSEDNKLGEGIVDNNGKFNIELSRIVKNNDKLVLSVNTFDGEAKVTVNVTENGNIIDSNPNPNTGDSSIFSSIATLVTAAAAFVGIKKKKD
ncbi:Ig-like domain-containing protein, partial [Helcococcus ovis]